MKIFFLILLTISVLTISANAQAITAEPATLRVEAGKTLDLKAADLAKLSRREARGKDHDGKESIYSGFELREVLKLAGAKIGGNQLRGKELANLLLVEAADGYKAVFALTELDSDFTDKVVLLADTKDGKPLSEKQGRWQVIVPDEKKHGRWVRQVTKLSIKTAQ